MIFIYPAASKIMAMASLFDCLTAASKDRYLLDCRRIQNTFHCQSLRVAAGLSRAFPSQRRGSEYDGSRPAWCWVRWLSIQSRCAARREQRWPAWEARTHTRRRYSRKDSGTSRRRTTGPKRGATPWVRFPGPRWSGWRQRPNGCKGTWEIPRPWSRGQEFEQLGNTPSQYTVGRWRYLAATSHQTPSARTCWANREPSRETASNSVLSAKSALCPKFPLPCKLRPSRKQTRLFLVGRFLQPAIGQMALIEQVTVCKKRGLTPKSSQVTIH